MTKTELVERLAEQAGVTKTSATRLLDAFVVAVTDALKQGDKITLTGLGSFKTSQRKERTARNPHTGEEITVPARTAPVFRASRAMKESIS